MSKIEAETRKTRNFYGCRVYTEGSFQGSEILAFMIINEGDENSFKRNLSLIESHKVGLNKPIS